MLSHHQRPPHDPFTPATSFVPPRPQQPFRPALVCHRCFLDLPAANPTGRLCRACARRRGTMWIAAGIATAVVATGAVLLVMFVPGKKQKAPTEPPASSYVPAPVPAADGDLEAAAIASCDAGKIRRLVEAYNQEDKYAASVRVGTAYQTKCKRSPSLDWDLLYAHEQLEQWQPAERVADRLLREEPSDNDFWWWRAKNRGHLGRHHGAIADVRQSLTGADERNNGVQINHLSPSAKAVDERCETAFALRWIANAGVDLHSGAQREFHEEYLAGKCEKLDGKGSLTWTAGGLRRTKPQTGKVGDRKATFLIDRGLGTTLVTKALAEQLGLERGDTLDILTPTGLGTGAASHATITVAHATAAAVPVAILDELPEGVDAVIGLSFLWRFEVKPTDDGFRASAATDSIDESTEE